MSRDGTRRDRSVGAAPAGAQRAPRAAGPRVPALALQRMAGNAAVVHAMRHGVLARAPATAPAPAAGQTHTVAAGESLAAIAKKYGVTTEALMKANPGKVKSWETPKGLRQGFNAGEVVAIPSTAVQATKPAPVSNPGPVSAADRPAAQEPGMVGYAIDWWSKAWDRFWEEDAPVPTAKPEVKTPAPTTPPPAVVTPATTTATTPASPVDVIKARVADKTFSQNVTVNSTKRDGDKQLKILRDYCKANKAALDKYAEDNDWLKDSLDWDKFDTAALSDDAIWLPFFFALYYGGGGPGTKTEDRTLPLVASPAQKTWDDKKGKTRTANASPHIAGKAMDVDAPDLDVLDTELKTKIPEFSATGTFPINSTQKETAAGQTAVHINFKNVVF